MKCFRFFGKRIPVIGSEDWPVAARMEAARGRSLIILPKRTNRVLSKRSSKCSAGQRSLVVPMPVEISPDCHIFKYFIGDRAAVVA